MVMEFDDFFFSSALPHFLSNVELIPPQERLLLELEFKSINEWTIRKLKTIVIVADSEISHGGAKELSTLASKQYSRMLVLLLSMLTSEHQNVILAHLVGSGLVGLLQTVIRLTGSLLPVEDHNSVIKETVAASVSESFLPNVSTHTEEAASGADFVQLMTSGTRVIRGTDWKWDDQVMCMCMLFVFHFLYIDVFIVAY